MLVSINILSKDSGILLYDHNLTKFKMNKKLFSALLIAVRDFCSDINIGDCNVFRSDQYTVISTSINHLVIAFIVDKDDSHFESFWKKLGIEIGKKFENIYDLHEFSGNITQFSNFTPVMNEILIEWDVI